MPQTRPVNNFIELYESHQYDDIVLAKLKIAEAEAESTTKRYTLEEVMIRAKERIARAKQKQL